MALSSKVSSVSVKQDTSMPISSSGSSTRSCILQVGVCAGKLCAVANTLTATKNETTANGLSVAEFETEEYDAMVLAMTELMISLWETSVSLDINLVVAVRDKLELNKRKYPVHLCKGKAGKYTEYSKETGVTKSNQSTVGVAGVSATISNSDGTIANPTNNTNNKPVTKEALLAEIPILAEDIRAFATEREWAKYHTPRNLILALLEEQPIDGGVAGVSETISNSDGTITNPTNDPNNKPITKEALLAEIPILAEDIRAFATEREWAKYHTPRNLILALLGEVGELAELVQWKGDDCDGVTDTNAGEPTAPFDSLEMVQLSQELADV
eukprot:CAMPEP_0171322472 /NCGR_PEP_ID=MMETSP0816-20121228/114982_1 /TAXON_ID=420281 /ORGANISM="Proboscia inermis, Strain CCAP1064/1" /LENGTH=327 /DNA_ID=CAMNT_0011820959 /DNA_START=183 /DNA_END=1167 /DNA_ORIENTATION=+